MSDKLEVENVRMKKRITELKSLIEEMIEVMLYAINKVECIDYEYATKHRAKGLILKWQNIQQHLTINQ
jgi:hypothetical protein